jgi:hypothetical protein
VVGEDERAEALVALFDGETEKDFETSIYEGFESSG